MLQREGRRFEAGLEKDVLERSVSQSLSLLCGLSVAHCLGALPAIVSADFLYCVFYCMSKHPEFLQTNTLINHSRQFRPERKKEDKKLKTKGRDRVRNPELIVSFLFFICLMCCG